MHTICDKKLVMMRPEKIIVPPWRIRRKFDEAQLKSLAKSISVNGIIEPLLIRQVGNGCYEIIAGERRLKAAIMIGLRRVPCIVHKIDAETSLVYSLIENIHRSELTRFEEGAGAEKLITVSGISQKEAAFKLGVAQSTVMNRLRILRFNEEQRMKISESGLTEKTLLALISLPFEQREDIIEHLWQDYSAENREIEYINKFFVKEKAEKTKPREETEEKPLRKFAIGDIRLFSNSLLKLTESLKSSGVGTSFKTYETERYIEYRIKIKKEPQPKAEAVQLKLC